MEQTSKRLLPVNELSNAELLEIVNVTIFTIAHESWRPYYQWVVVSDEERAVTGDLPIDLITLQSALIKSERWIGSQEHRSRVRASGSLPLGGRALEAFWQHQELIPESWKQGPDRDPRYIYFDGTIFESTRDQQGPKVFFLSWYGGKWHRHLSSCMRNASRLSAVLKQ